MIMLASDWLAVALLLCVFAWFAGRWLTVALPFAVTMAALAVYAPTGSPRFTQPPPGRYTVVGADIQVNVAILVLLKGETGDAVYYRLLYTNEQANQLQSAMDTNGGLSSGGVHAEIGEDGGTVYDGDPPVAGSAPKAAEQPTLNLP